MAASLQRPPWYWPAWAGLPTPRAIMAAEAITALKLVDMPEEAIMGPPRLTRRLLRVAVAATGIPGARLRLKRPTRLPPTLGVRLSATGTPPTRQDAPGAPVAGLSRTHRTVASRA